MTQPFGERFVERADVLSWGRVIRQPQRVAKPFFRDELPQLINVVRGDMSLVGPRPERPVFIEQFRKTIPNYMARHSVKCAFRCG